MATTVEPAVHSQKVPTPLSSHPAALTPVPGNRCSAFYFFADEITVIFLNILEQIFVFFKQIGKWKLLLFLANTDTNISFLPVWEAGSHNL